MSIRFDINMDTRAMEGAIDNLSAAFDRLSDSVSSIRDDINNTSNDMGDLETAFTTPMGVMGLMGIGLSGMSAAFKDTTSESGNLMSSLGLVQDGLFDMQSVTNDAGETVTVLSGKLRTQNQNVKMLGNTMDGLTFAKFKATAATTGLTLAKIGFQAIATAGVFFAISLGIAAVATALQGAWDWITRTTQSYRDFRDRNEEVAEAIDEVSDRLANNRQSHANNVQGIQNSADVNGRLINRLSDLADAEDLSDAQRAQKIATIRELNDSIEGLNLVYCEQTGILDENSQLQLEQLHLRNDLEAATATAEAQQERLNEAMHEEAEVLAMIEDLDFAGQREEMTAALEAGELTQGRYNSLLADMEENYESLREELEIVRVEIGELEEEWYDSLTNMSELTDQYVADQQLSWSSLSEHQQGVMNDLKNMITDYTDHAQNRMDTLCDRVTVSGRDMIDNMLENQRVLETWSDNIALLAERGIDEGLLEEMRQMGPEGAAQVAAMVEMSGEELAEMNDVYRQGAQVATDALATQLGPGFEDAVNMASHFVQDSRTTMENEIANANFEGIGQSIPEGAARGIARNTDAIREARGMMDGVNDAAADAIGYNSPARVYVEYGESIVQGLYNGIEALQSRPVDAIESVASSMERVYNRSERGYQTIGRDIIRGLNQGLLNGENSVMNTANRIANNIARTMRNALDINSPSRVMREQIGRFIPEGIGAGIDKYANTAIDSVQKLGNDLLRINIPSVEDIIGMKQATLSLAATRHALAGNVTNNNQRHSYAGLFDGATINWNGEEDIRRTMEKMARAAEEDSARMW